jgi:hypothetical protein
MADQPYKSDLNEAYIRQGSANPVYQDKLQNRINLDDQRPLGDAVEAARKSFYTPDATKGRNNWKGVILSVEPADESQNVNLSRYAGFMNLSSIKTIYRIYIPELHLFGEPPKFNICDDGKLDPAIVNKIKMYPVVIPSEELQGDLKVGAGSWVSVNFLDSTNYEYGIITSPVKGITPYTAPQAKESSLPFNPCAGNAGDVPLIPGTDININGEDKKNIILPSLTPSELDLFVYNIVTQNGGDDIDFYIVRSFITAESANDPSALSATGCAGYGQFCFTTAIDYSEAFVGKKVSQKTKLPSNGGLLTFFEGPTGTVYESINAKSPSVEDIMQAVTMNFFGGRTSSLVSDTPNRKNTQAGNDYLDYLKGKGVSIAMERVMTANGIEPDDQLQNLSTYLRQTAPYNAFLESQTRKVGNKYKVVPKSDARFDGQKNILAMFRYLNRIRSKSTTRNNPYAMYMWYNQGPGFQKTVMREILKEINNNLNFNYPPQNLWTNQLFESVAPRVTGRNPIIRAKDGGVGKYPSYVRGIFTKIKKEIDRLKETFNIEIGV